MPSDGIAAVMMFYMLNKIADCTENVVWNLLSSEGKKRGINIYGGKTTDSKKAPFYIDGSCRMTRLRSPCGALLRNVILTFNINFNGKVVGRAG